MLVSNAETGKFYFVNERNGSSQKSTETPKVKQSSERSKEKPEVNQSCQNIDRKPVRFESSLSKTSINENKPTVKEKKRRESSSEVRNI